MVSDKILRIYKEVDAEVQRAVAAYNPMASAHEGYAVLAEEVDELWDAVRMKQADPARPAEMREEAIQVAAMAIRFVLDVCDKDK